MSNVFEGVLELTEDHVASGNHRSEGKSGYNSAKYGLKKAIEALNLAKGSKDKTYDIMVMFILPDKFKSNIWRSKFDVDNRSKYVVDVVSDVMEIDDSAFVRETFSKIYYKGDKVRIMIAVDEEKLIENVDYIKAFGNTLPIEKVMSRRVAGWREGVNSHQGDVKLKSTVINNGGLVGWEN